MLVSHGHFDHIADVPAIAKRPALKSWPSSKSRSGWRKRTKLPVRVAMNIGGGVKLPFGHVKMTTARHSSQLPDGSYGGEPAGFLLTLGRKGLYFACDTGLFRDMELIGAAGIDLAVVPIGDLFTMGPEDAVEAIKLIKPAARGSGTLQHLAAHRTGCPALGRAGSRADCGPTRGAGTRRNGHGVRLALAHFLDRFVFPRPAIVGIIPPPTAARMAATFCTSGFAQGRQNHDDDPTPPWIAIAPLPARGALGNAG